MKIVVVESKENEGCGSRLGVLVPEEDLWSFQVLCARAGQRILVIKEEKDAS
jgi:hypothetical protein